ncbi:MAG: p-hydroxycinnamoyl CoA hydratase/lyase [Candidatus Tectomicrobia bacterium]|nr:p-hydroxycinnamoyl CoA hydratase/lyase [Candidatus Tectomicrobia bacterium]
MNRSYETIRLEKANGVTTVFLNRPEKKNAMSPQMHREMTEALAFLEDDDETRVVVITGSGDSFCAGQDLQKFFVELEGKPQERRRVSRLSAEWQGVRLRLFPKPTIASINGWCFGGAFTTVASCDLAVAAEEATFGLSEVNFANFPGGLVTRALDDLLRPRDFLYYAMTGEPFDGKAAAAIGLVNFAVPRKELDAAVRRLAEKLLTKDPMALRQVKEVYKFGKQMNWEQAYAWAMAKGNELTFHQKGTWLEEGIGQFREKKYRPGLGDFEREK